MNFFEQQRLAKRNSRLLLILFFVAALITSLLTSVLLTIVFQANTDEHYAFSARSLIQNQGFQITTAAVIAILMVISVFKALFISKKGSQIALNLGGIPVNSQSKDFLERRYLNVVEEMSLASRVPVPDVFVLPNEDSINAFAAGNDINHSAIAVTRGTLEKLNREELQGVVAHEFSHVLNGDSKLNLKMLGYLFGITCIFESGRILLRSMGRSRYSSRRSKNNSGGQIALVGVGLMVIGGVGMLMASWIKSFISREREYLADASAVQFTRNPLAVGQVLKKLIVSSSISSNESFLQAEKAGEYSHMFFSEGLKAGFLSFFSFATHPPLMQRIRAVQPNYSQKTFESEIGEIQKSLQRTEENNLALLETGNDEPVKKESQEGRFEQIQKTAMIAVAAGSALKQAGTIQKESIEKSHAVLVSNESELNQIADIDQAKAVVLELCRDDSAGNAEAADRDRQAALLMRAHEWLKTLPKIAARDFMQSLYQVITRDGGVEHRELIVFMRTREVIDPGFLAKPSGHRMNRTLATSTLLRFILKYHAGSDHELVFQSISEHFFKGLLKNDVDVSPLKLIAAIDYIKKQSDRFKETVTHALLTCIEADGEISSEEYDLVALVCTCFQVPLPVQQ